MVRKDSTNRAAYPHHAYTLNSLMLGGKLYLEEVVSFDSEKDTGLAVSPAFFCVIPHAGVLKGANKYGLDSFRFAKSGRNDLCGNF